LELYYYTCRQVFDSALGRELGPNGGLTTSSLRLEEQAGMVTNYFMRTINFMLPMVKKKVNVFILTVVPLLIKKTLFLINNIHQHIQSVFGGLGEIFRRNRYSRKTFGIVFAVAKVGEKIIFMFGYQIIH